MIGIGAGIAAALIAASAATQGVPPQYPASAFGALPFIEYPVLSPDGTHIAARTAVGGRQQLVITALAAGGTPAVATTGDLQIGWFRWANDRRLLLSVNKLETDPNIRGPFQITRLISIDAQAGSLMRLGWQVNSQFGDRIVDQGEAARDTVLLASRSTMYRGDEGYFPSVISVDVASGASRTVERPRVPIYDWFADPAGEVRVGVGYLIEGNTGTMIYRKSAAGAFQTVATAHYAKDERLPAPVLLRAGSDTAVVTSDRSGREGLYDYDLAQGSFGAKIFEDPRYDVGGVVLSTDGKQIAGVHYTEERPHTVWLDADLATVQADIDKAVAPRFADIVSLDAAHRRLIVRVSSPTDPGAYYLMDRAEGAMRRFAGVNAALKGAVLAPMTAVHYAARDGLDIPAFLTLPVGRAPKGLPLIVMPHGGPWARDVLGYDFWVQFLANRGYAVLQPNFRGSTGYGKAFRDAGDGEWGHKMQDDVTDGVRWLAAQGIVDAKRVCIVGASYGGYAALQGVVRDLALYRCAISFAGVADLVQQGRFSEDFLYYKRYTRALTKAAPDYRSVSPANFAATITAPVLLVHGKKDQVVLFAQSELMAAALKRAGKTFEFVTQPEGDHHLSRQADRIQLLELTEAFLKKHNPAD